MQKVNLPVQSSFLIVLCVCVLGVLGCSATKYREKADKAATDLIHQAQLKALGRTEPFSIEIPSNTLRRHLLLDQKLPFSGAASLGVDELSIMEHWPEKNYPLRSEASESPAPPWEEGEPLKLTLIDSLQVAAANNREYQTKKEDIFKTALILYLEDDAFRNSFLGALQGLFTDDRSGVQNIRGVEASASAGWTRRLKSGATLFGGIFFDLAKLLTLDRSSSFGIFADASIAIPLLAGSGKHIVTEPLKQAERNLVYAIYTFERFKRTFAVQVASGYLAVLNQMDQLKNQEDNYRRIILAARNATRLADAGRLPKIQVDQAYQDVFRARVSWIAAQQTYKARLDSFKIDLGLPPDTRIELDRSELNRLAFTAKAALENEFSSRLTVQEEPLGSNAPVELVQPSREGGGPLELDPKESIEISFRHRMDLRILQGRVYDAQRKVIVAADALKAGLTLTGTAEVGGRRGISSSDLPDAKLRINEGRYSAGLFLELPWERTEEQIAYRNSYITLQRAVRAVQELEDQIKLQLRNKLRDLLEARENYIIQTQATKLAHDRVKSSELFLQAGRAQMRDVLEAQEALLNTQNALTAALVNYRISELELQRDMGVIEIDPKGLWNEYEFE